MTYGKVGQHKARSMQGNKHSAKPCGVGRTFLNRRAALLGVAATPLVASTLAGAKACAAPPAIKAPPQTTGVNGDQGYAPAGSFEVVAEFYGPGPSGV
ncbi:MAG: hypothetical protein L0I33_03390, partial [Acetobacter sp.]|nr:hypothetical protein [Acetobacter sp.]